ncbi:MAG: 50S ribosomal protein L21 [Candidatus Dormibacteria bacterium]
MYAILAHGGHQYRVAEGDRLLVDRLDAEVGATVTLAPVLLTGGDGPTRTGADVAGVEVAAVVVAHRRGPKLRVFTYKAKKRSRTTRGHRSDLTEVRVAAIVGGGGTVAETAKAAPRRRRAAASAAAPAAEVEEAPQAPSTPAAVGAAAAEPQPVPTAPATRTATKRGPARESQTQESGDGA